MLNRLTRERLVQPNPSIDLAVQNSEMLVTANTGLMLLGLRERRHDREVMPGMCGNGLGRLPHQFVKTIKPQIHIVQTFPQLAIRRRDRIQEALKRSCHYHALADARTIGCSLELVVKSFGKPDGNFAGYQAVSLTTRRHGRLRLAGLRIEFGVKLHILVFPNLRPGRQKSEMSLASIDRRWRSHSVVAKERNGGLVSLSRRRL